MKLSVVICTRNRAAALLHCLESIDLAARRAALTDAEIVVTDNGSSDGTPEMVRNWATGASIAVRLEHEPRPGITITKNRGLRAANGEILVLTDDDCRLHPDYFVHLLRLHAADPTAAALRGGRVELGDPGDLPLTIKTDTAPRRWHIGDHSARYENLGNCFLGCNLFMTRAVYERLGPFDERFGVGAIPAGEDTDYIFRAYAAGLAIEYVPEIVVYHYHGRKAPEAAHRLWRNYMIGSGALYAKHVMTCPSLCLQLRWDLKNFAREIMARKNLFLPDYGFSYADKMRCYAAGAASFLSSALSRAPAGDRR